MLKLNKLSRVEIKTCEQCDGLYSNAIFQETHSGFHDRQFRGFSASWSICNTTPPQVASLDGSSLKKAVCLSWELKQAEGGQSQGGA